MRLRGGGITRSITVRSVRSGVGVERTFKVNSPRIDKIEVVRHGVARRAQLYFLRKRVGKAASLRERRPTGSAASAGADAMAVTVCLPARPAARPARVASHPDRDARA
jgi:large subunit ribosomal protein L19